MAEGVLFYWCWLELALQFYISLFCFTFPSERFYQLVFRMKYGFILFLFMAASCVKKNTGLFYINSLDKIIGDKIIGEDSIRPNNFQTLIGLSKSDLLMGSKNYIVRKIDDDLFLIGQNKKYSYARHFNLLVETHNDTVKDYIVFNDFSIIDVKKDSSNLIILLSDWENSNKYWKSQQQIQIKQFDSGFRENWSINYTNNTYPLHAEGFDIQDSVYVFDVQIMTICHACYSQVKLYLSKTGDFITVNQVGNINSHPLNQTTLSELFNIRNTKP